MIVKKRVCVIGAGPSGIVAVKELKEQNIEVKCFESQNSIGGAFRSTKEGGRLDYPINLVLFLCYFIIHFNSNSFSTGVL